MENLDIMELERKYYLSRIEAAEAAKSAAAVAWEQAKAAWWTFGFVVVGFAALVTFLVGLPWIKSRWIATGPAASAPATELAPVPAVSAEKFEAALGRIHALEMAWEEEQRQQRQQEEDQEELPRLRAVVPALREHLEQQARALEASAECLRALREELGRALGGA